MKLLLSVVFLAASIAAACGGGYSTTPPSITIAISPTSAQVTVGNTAQFTANVSNSSSTGVTWQVNGTVGGNSTVGTISASGLYKAPSTVPSPATVTITAVLVAASNISVSATVTVLPASAVTVSPAATTVAGGTSQQFTATVQGAGSNAVIWAVNGVAGGNPTTGTIDAKGLYSAPPVPPAGGTVTVTATSTVNAALSGSATVTVVLFGPASLHGQYAYSMSGEDLSGNFIARVGSLFADGNGNITQGLEDVNTATVVTQVSFTGGNYTIQPNGRGVLTLTNSASSLRLSITLISPNKGFMVQTDLNATSSGNFTLQTPTAFTLAGVKGNYVFDFSGVNGTGAPTSIIGQVKADGAGNVTGGTADVSSGTTGNSGAQPVPATTYVIDTTNGTTFGRGTSTINGISYVFYIVDATRIKFMGITIGALLGDAVLQNGTIPTTTAAFTGNFVLLTGGSSVLGTMGPLTRAGRFTSNSGGNLTNVFVDTNNFGSRHSTTPVNVSAASFSIDTTATVVGSGRGTLTIQDSTVTDAFNFVFYLISPTQAVIQDTSNGIIADGSMLAQAAGPLTFSSTGNFAFNWSGIILATSNTAQFEEDFVGQYSPGSLAAGGFSGAMDFTELGSANKNLFLNVPITVTTSINSNVSDGTGPNGYRVVTGNSPSSTFDYRAYIVDQNTVFLMGFDSNQVIAGTVVAQP